MAKKARPKYPKLNRLIGLMREHSITVHQLSKLIGRAPSTISKSNNGWTLYDSMDMMNIQRVINERSETKYTLDEIFCYDVTKTKRK